VTHDDPADLRVRRRLAEISERLSELRARSHEMSDPGTVFTPERERPARAAARASQARAHAIEAARLALAAYLHSADVHDRVADLYDELALTGVGNVVRYEKQAERHRQLAEVDRSAGAHVTDGAATPDARLGAD
jgi:hypothetical protein